MDRKSITVIGVCLLLLLLIQRLADNIFPPVPASPETTNMVSTPGGLPDTNATAATPTGAGATASVSPVSVSANAVASFTTNTEEQTLTVTNDYARYIFTSRGGGLKEIQLVKYPESVSTLRKKAASDHTVAVATLNNDTLVPVLALLDDGTTEGDGVFALARTATGARATKTLLNGLNVVKDFEIGSNYLVTATVRLENDGPKPLALPAHEIVIGTATPLSVQDKGQFVNAYWYNGLRMTPVNVSYFSTNTSVLGFFSRVPKTIYTTDSTNLLWATVQNQFFTIAAMPQITGEQLVVRPVDLLPDLNRPADPFVPRGLQASLAYPAVNLPPGKASEEKVIFFAGPKKYNTLAQIADQFNNDLDLIMGFDQMIFGRFSAFFAKGLLLSMNWLHGLTHLPYGWVIIMITVIIKVIFWPLTAASTRSMKRMQALQPQMKAIAEKYKDDAVKKNQKTMEFMREHKVNPMGGCLPMLIQIPIFMGFYAMIQSAIELRGAPFLWIGDLSRPDTVYTFAGMGFVPIIGIPGVGLPINILPLIMGATQVWQAHLIPPSPNMDQSQQKMMRFMPLFMMLILYNFSAGLTLYWTSQTLLTIIQTKLTKTNPNDPLLAPHPKKAK